MSTRAGIDDYDENGMTPLLYAVFAGDIDVVRSLLDAGADPDKPQRDDPSATPLWHAQEDFGLHAIANLLWAYGAGSRDGGQPA